MQKIYDHNKVEQYAKKWMINYSSTI